MSQDAHFYARGSQDEGFATVGQMDSSHPSMKDADGWPATKFFYAAAVDPGNARVVARLADGTPLLIDKQMGEGHVLLFASGFDNVTNDLAAEPGVCRVCGPDGAVSLRRGASERSAGGGFVCAAA